ncbi:hypothetical protein [Thalassoglobus sp.]|uniref:hypothetical protein n=1 Tax=Thalassoglobus sp. TaxID=2795869 RepID=UPI003AA9A949
MTQVFDEQVHQKVSRLDQVWRAWLFDNLDHSEALQRMFQIEQEISSLPDSNKIEEIENVLFKKLQVQPYLNAMVAAIVELRSSLFNDENAFVRGRAFYNHLPKKALQKNTDNGMLTVPFPGETGPRI